jgi:hypothetical protein
MIYSVSEASFRYPGSISRSARRLVFSFFRELLEYKGIARVLYLEVKSVEMLMHAEETSWKRMCFKEVLFRVQMRRISRKASAAGD